MLSPTATMTSEKDSTVPPSPLEEHIQTQTARLMSGDKLGGLQRIKTILDKYEDRYCTSLKLLSTLRTSSNPNNNDHVSVLAASIQEQAPSVSELAAELLPLVNELLLVNGVDSAQHMATTTAGSGSNGAAAKLSTKTKTKS